MFYGFIMKLASFNVIPLQNIYNMILPAPSWDRPINDSFDNLGFSSVFLLNNMGSMILGIVALPLLLCVFILLRPISIFSKGV
jgi:hypothetical protein